MSNKRQFEVDGKTYTINLGDPMIHNRMAEWSGTVEDLKIFQGDPITDEKYEIIAGFVKTFVEEEQFDAAFPDGQDIFTLMEFVVAVAPLFNEAMEKSKEIASKMYVMPGYEA